MISRFVVIVLFILFSVSAHAEVISSIAIKGNERVEESTIKSYVDITPGVSFNHEQLDSSIKKLYASNLFQKVNIAVKGNILYVDVVENPKINLVVFEGNSKIKTKDLEAEVSLKSRSIYTKAKVQEDVNSIIELYNKNGRFSAKVIPQVIILPQNRVNLIYKIDEGPMAKIAKIKFVGNNHFSDSRLESEISSRETRWYYFLSNSDKFNPTRIEYDRELLTRFYQSRGYADFKIISVITNISSRKERFYITFTIDEGAKYKFGKIQVESMLKDASINMDEIKSDLLTKEKDVYDIRKIEKTVDNIISTINDEGYAFVDVDPEIYLDQENKVVNITYRIGESRRVYINKINIKGNVRTADKVIRREFRLAEGDPYNSTKISRSEQRINNLDFFEKTTIETARTDESDKVDLNLNLQEKSTSSISFAGGYSTTDGPLARIGFNEPNLLGNGQELNLSLMKTESKFNGDIALTEPYLFDMPLAGTVQLFTKDAKRDSRHYSYYNSTTNGVLFNFAYDLTEFLGHNVYYSFSHNKISNISSDASDALKEAVGVKNNSMVGQGLTYDRLDSKHNPTDGYVIGVGQDYAGVGGNVHFLRHTIKSRYYYPIYNDDVIFILAGEAGTVHGLEGKDVDINDRFFLGGGSTLRGFNYGGVGPRAIKDGATLGGNRYYSTTTEVKFPLGIGKEAGLFGAVFVDTGSLSKVDVDNKSEIWDSNSMRSSYGVGMGINSPMGPVRIHYAVPISKKFFDREKHFDITFSTAF